MKDKDSPIRDFYPLDFRVDCEGKRAEWEGVVLVRWALPALSYTTPPSHVLRLRGPEVHVSVQCALQLRIGQHLRVGVRIRIAYELSHRCGPTLNSNGTSLLAQLIQTCSRCTKGSGPAQCLTR